ncbi:NADP-dependent oxidoreductase domain-containing protein [Roridomyces roridus]|uniref:NADP-dependent oxidoreductase domain-containing protein n=1 Tax=Roridomyces roridus TaxID=1738132 RepID=A0AAD7CAN9_9AGAR|nr:NADP-dependent oxidoreductase domain-containing protein [Roridomyces roridus]
MPAPTLLFGGASIGDSFKTVQALETLLTQLKDLGITRIDTAARYPATNQGESERLLGEVGAVAKGFAVDTKINTGPGFGPTFPGSLTAEAIDKSLQQSYQSLAISGKGTEVVNVLYCHAPDSETPLEQQAAALDALFKKGMFKQLGLSNYPPEMVEKFVQICDKEGYVKPAVYQGKYNLVARGAEDALLPLLRQHDIAFIAYSPLAGGFLSGNFTAGNTEGTRFQEGTLIGDFIRPHFDKPELHAAIKALDSLLESHGISKPEAALRWACFHSALKAENGDGIILGASRAEQVVANVEAVKKGPLPEEVVKGMEGIWFEVKKGGA